MAKEKLIPVKDLISAKTQMFLIRAWLVTQTMRFEAVAQHSLRWAGWKSRLYWVCGI
ncbi:hypothetical protein [Paraburkholderia fungorum]|uniref:hypothetical protein n=1 Tax=Paraburkholderia fungorum TaxID=134537 RepID=UPI003877D1E0